MDGKTLLYRLRNLVDEDSAATWLDDRTSYDYLWEAAKTTTRRLKNLTAKQTIETIADQTNYELNADFLSLLNTSNDGRFFIKYTSTASDYFLYYRDLEKIRFNDYLKTYDTHQGTNAVQTRNATTFVDTTQDFSDWETEAPGTAVYKILVTNYGGSEQWAYLGDASTTTNANDTIAVYTDQGLTTTGWSGNNATPVMYRILKVSTQEIPDCFSLQDSSALNTQITGTATSDGDASGGKSLLTDTDAVFWTPSPSGDEASPGDPIHNTTDGSSGIVLSIYDGDKAYCALFGGTDNEWDTDDAYVIQPQGRVEIVLDPPPKNSLDMIEVWYVASPPPVYDDYGTYRFRQHVVEAIVKYAAWLYKYRDSEPDFGDKFYVQWDKAVRDESSDLNPYLKERRLRVNLKRRYGR